MRAGLISLLVVVIIGTALQASAAGENIIYVGKAAPFLDGNEIPAAVIAECHHLRESQIEWIQKAAAEDKSLEVIMDEEAVKAGKGRVLIVEIANVVSIGNHWAGHHKQVTLTGRLLENGVEVGSFSAVRSSKGGFGIRTSCSVLERCEEALGKDIALWLKKPGINSCLGNGCKRGRRALRSAQEKEDRGHAVE